MKRCLFVVPSRMTSLLFPPWCIATQTTTEGPWFPWVGWNQASISLSHCLRGTRALPSLWYGENRDSLMMMQCLQWRRSQTWCLWPHSRKHRLCTKVSLGHLACRRDRQPSARSQFIHVTVRTICQNREISASSAEEQEWNDSCWPSEANDECGSCGCLWTFDYS